VRVLVTRPAEAAARTAARLKRAGHQPVRLALSASRDSGVELPRGRFDGMVMTSAAAARVLEARGVPDTLARLPVHCVGAATAAAARRAGLIHAEKGPGTAAGLAAALAQHFGGRGQRLLYPAGEDRAFDMAAALATSGIEVGTVPIYRVELHDPGAAKLAAALAQCAGGAAFLYSPRTAAHLFTLAERHGQGNGMAGLTFMAISENVAAAIPGRRNFSVLVAESPDEDGLMDLLSRRGRASSRLTISGA